MYHGMGATTQDLAGRPCGPANGSCIYDLQGQCRDTITQGICGTPGGNVPPDMVNPSPGTTYINPTALCVLSGVTSAIGPAISFAIIGAIAGAIKGGKAAEWAGYGGAIGAVTGGLGGCALGYSGAKAASNVDAAGKPVATAGW